MLDEIKAYEEYTMPVVKDKECRLQPEVFTRKMKLAGLRDILTYVARHEAYEIGYYDAREETRRECVDQVIEEVKLFMGLSDKGDNSNSWLKSYYETKIMDINKGRSWERFCNYNFQNINTTIRQSVEESIFGDENTFQKITFESIVADALEEGPLRRYCLECDNRFGEDLYKMPSDKHELTDLKKLKPENKKDGELLSMFYRFMACYMKYRSTHRGVVHISAADLSNWGRIPNAYHDYGEYFGKIYYENKQLIHCRQDSVGNSICTVDPEYIYKYNLKIIRYRSKLIRKPEKMYIEDKGCFEPLNIQGSAVEY